MQRKCWCYLLLSYILNNKFTVIRRVLWLAKNQLKKAFCRFQTKKKQIHSVKSKSKIAAGHSLELLSRIWRCRPCKQISQTSVTFHCANHTSLISTTNLSNTFNALAEVQSINRPHSITDVLKLWSIVRRTRRLLGRVCTHKSYIQSGVTRLPTLEAQKCAPTTQVWCQ